MQYSPRRSWFPHRAVIACALAVLVGACSEDSGGGGGSGGSGGSAGGSSGRGGSGSGGTGGSSTTGGSGGSTGGSGGSGGSTGGTGGSTGGTGGATGGTGGSTGGTGGSAMDGGKSDGTKDSASGDGAASDLGSAPLPPPGDSPITQGFRQVMPMWNIQSPRNVPRDERYKYDAATGVHTMINLSTDEAFQAGNNTDPRTEFRWTNEYSSGTHMFDADLFLVPGSNRTCIMQVFGAAGSATTLMITAWGDGHLRRYFGGEPPPEILIPNAAGRWMNLKVMHDTGAGMINIYENDKLIKTIPDRGGGGHHFKNGVYGTTMRSETRWRNIRYWVKN